MGELELMWTVLLVLCLGALWISIRHRSSSARRGGQESRPEQVEASRRSSLAAESAAGVVSESGDSQAVDVIEISSFPVEAEPGQVAAEAQDASRAVDQETGAATDQEAEAARCLAAEQLARIAAEAQAAAAQAEAARRAAAEQAEKRETEARAARAAAEAEARRVAVEAEAERAAAEAEAQRLVIEAEAQRLAAEAEATRRAEEAEARRLAAEAEARRRAEAEARRMAEAAEAQRLAAEAEVARRATEAEAARLAAEQQADSERVALREAALVQQRKAANEAARIAREHEAIDSPPAITRPTRPEQTLVMVADDSKVVRVKTSRLLSQHGYRVVLAEDGADAARKIEAEPPHVLITDVEMPGMDGFALTRFVRQHPCTQDILVLMITGANDRHSAQAAASGVSVMLGKPYAEGDLIAHVASALAPATAAAA